MSSRFTLPHGLTSPLHGSGVWNPGPQVQAGVPTLLTPMLPWAVVPGLRVWEMEEEGQRVGGVAWAGEAGREAAASPGSPGAMLWEGRVGRHH